jgi:hypothetical protein
MANVVVPGRKLWRSEIAEARRLGFKLLLSIGDTASYAKLVPETARARRSCRAHNAGAIEAQQVIPPAANRTEYAKYALEAQKDAIDAALLLARDAC